jgi:hypothetical protein
MGVLMILAICVLLGLAALVALVFAVFTLTVCMCSGSAGRRCDMEQKDGKI